MTEQTDEAGLAEIRALRRRLADLEALARQQAPPAGFGDALRAMRAHGSASGPGIDRLRASVGAGSTPSAIGPGPAELAAATRTVLDGLGGSGSIEAAYAAMKATGRRRDAIETASPGASGRFDVLDPETATAADKLDKILKGQRP